MGVPAASVGWLGRVWGWQLDQGANPLFCSGVGRADLPGGPRTGRFSQCGGGPGWLGTDGGGGRGREEGGPSVWKPWLSASVLCFLGCTVLRAGVGSPSTSFDCERL